MTTLDSPRKRDCERGAGHFKAIFWTAVLLSLVFVGFKVVPVLINNYQFQDGIQNIARFGSVNHISADAIKKSVLEEAQKDDLPVQADDIKVQSAGRDVGITVDYSVPVDLKVYQWTLNFHPSASNKAIF